MNIPTIDKLTFVELTELQNQVTARISHMREAGAPQLLEEFSRKSAEFGLSLEEVLDGIGRKRRQRRRGFSLFRKRAPAAAKTTDLTTATATPTVAQR